jgi:hypothetical protein
MWILVPSLLLQGAAPAAQTTAPAVPEPAPSLAAPAADDLWKRLRFNADARLRGESTFNQANATEDDRHRGRLRMRVGAEYDVQEDLRLGARLTTVSDGRDANNPHWDFGDDDDGSSAAELGLDRLYLDYRGVDHLQLTGGKFAHPFTRPPVTREFAWDDDVQPAGAAAIFRPGTEGGFDFDARALYGVVAENSGNEDPAVAALQANFGFDVAKSVRMHAASSFSEWSSIDAYGGFSPPPPASGANQGNTVPLDGSTFGIWDSYFSTTFKGGPLKQVVGFVQYLENMHDDGENDDGFVLGAQVGKSGAKGDANVFAAYYDLDADSVFTPVAQDDTPIAGTGVGNGMHGFVFGAQYFVSDRFSVRLWALTSDADASDDPFRARLDLEFRVL